MIPNYQISSTPLLAEMLTPDLNTVARLRDYEDGGVDIQNTTSGVRGHQWVCYTDGASVYVKRDGLPANLVFTQPRLVEISFAFDQNMRPNFAYQLDDGLIYLRWYDTSLQAYRTDSFGAGRDPRLTLDDKRSENVSNSDVIFAYIRGESLYYRQQRDRYLVERLVATGIPKEVKLKNVGLSRNMRLQFEVVE